MGFTCGIIGLPNVGKSTIFNALSGAGAQMENYPFCTIEANRGIVPVPDTRLFSIAELLKKKNPIPTRIEFVDVAGLVEGASKGEGLGNKFLSDIRSVDALIHVVRTFTDENIPHTMGGVDPIRDIEIINTELILSDMEVLERALEKARRISQSGDKEAKKKITVIEKILSGLDQGEPVSSLSLSVAEKELVSNYGLITDKPALYVVNQGEDTSSDTYLKNVADYAGALGAEAIPLTGKLEEEISELPDNEKKEYLTAMGLEEMALERLIHAAYTLLNLITYYTAETELQAWTLEKETPAARAAGKIHSDFERGFIRAEVLHFDDLQRLGSLHAVKEEGLLRSEGKDYIIQDGDIVRYLFNV